jgi:hypothetical protein
MHYAWSVTLTINIALRVVSNVNYNTALRVVSNVNYHIALRVVSNVNYKHCTTRGQ